MSDLDFTARMGASHFFTAFSLWLASSPSQVSMWVECDMGASLGNQEATRLPALLSVWELSNHRAGTIFSRL